MFKKIDEQLRYAVIYEFRYDVKLSLEELVNKLILNGNRKLKLLIDSCKSIEYFNDYIADILNELIDLGGVCAVFKEESNTQLYSKGNNYRAAIIDIMKPLCIGELDIKITDTYTDYPQVGWNNIANTVLSHSQLITLGLDAQFYGIVR